MKTERNINTQLTRIKNLEIQLFKLKNITVFTNIGRDAMLKTCSKEG